MSIWRNVWSVLNTEIEVQTVIEGSVDVFSQVLALAGTLQEHQDEVAVLVPLVGKLDSVLDVLNSPLVQVAGASVPFLPLATGLLQAAIKATRQEPELKDEVLLVAQVAYVEAVRCFLKAHPEISEQLTTPASPELQQQIRKLGNALELSDKGIEDVLLCFPRSEVAAQFNPLLCQRLEESGIDAAQAELLTRRIACTVHRYLKKAVAEVQDEARQLVAIYGDGWQRDLEAYRSIDDYLETRIAGLPQETVFDETFAFAQIYVPSEVQPVVEGEVQQHQPRRNIEAWARDCLLDDQKAAQVLFIQGGPGRGKSVFCRMFADWVRRELHPIFTPILIRLRDGIDLKHKFDEALSSAVGWDFVTSDSGWLTDLNTRYLFLLDGFDELFLEQGGKGSVQELLEQVARFQERSARNPERGHRVLITGRPLALYGIERQMPTNLDWVSIALMDAAAQGQWLQQWQTVTDADTTEAFRAFLQNSDCPEQVQRLAQEPLLLYLLGKMHRDGALHTGMFSAGDANAAKVEVYEAAVDWVLQRQRPGKINPRLTDLEQDELRAVLAEAGLCVVQSGNERALIAMIEDRLVQRGDTAAAELIKEARSSKGQNPLKNALAAFYMKAGEEENSVEFFHKSFGEFLCAERLVESFKDWTEPGKRRAPYAIKDSEFEWQVYDLLGYGHLSQEILDYVMVLLKRDLSDEQWVSLFERLNDFYLRWSDGEFIEAIDVERILPLEKARQMQKLGIELGQRKSDVCAGTNTFRFLSTINRFFQKGINHSISIRFAPCGELNSSAFDSTRLSKVIHYISSQDAFAFLRKARKDLDHLDLRYSDLAYLNLWNANLESSNLESSRCHHSHFRKANFRDSNLKYTDFKHSDLSSSDLFECDLEAASLRKANLTNVDLTNANLVHTDFGTCNLSEANIKDIDFNERTDWTNVSGLELMKNIPFQLRNHPKFIASQELSICYNYAIYGELKKSFAALEKAKTIHPDIDVSTRLWRHLLWWSCIHNNIEYAQVAYREFSASTLNNNEILLERATIDIQGVYLGLLGDIQGATQCFSRVLSDNWQDKPPYFKQKRERWLADLRNGKNPFTPEELAKLREEEG